MSESDKTFILCLISVLLSGIAIGINQASFFYEVRRKNEKS